MSLPFRRFKVPDSRDGKRRIVETVSVFGKVMGTGLKPRRELEGTKVNEVPAGDLKLAAGLARIYQAIPSSPDQPR